MVDPSSCYVRLSPRRSWRCPCMATAAAAIILPWCSEGTSHYACPLHSVPALRPSLLCRPARRRRESWCPVTTGGGTRPPGGLGYGRGEDEGPRRVASVA